MTNCKSCSLEREHFGEHENSKEPEYIDFRSIILFYRCLTSINIDIADVAIDND